MSKIVYWTMANGEKIDIDSMGMEHLRNTLKMIVNNSQQRREIILNGDMAEQFNFIHEENIEELEY